MEGHIPQEHFADEAVLIDGLLVLTLWHLGPHLVISSTKRGEMRSGDPTSFTFSSTLAEIRDQVEQGRDGE